MVINFRVNAILPGFIETPMLKTVPDKVLKDFLKMIPLGRLGTPAGKFTSIKCYIFAYICHTAPSSPKLLADYTKHLVRPGSPTRSFSYHSDVVDLRPNFLVCSYHLKLLYKCIYDIYLMLCTSPFRAGLKHGDSLLFTQWVS